MTLTRREKIFIIGGLILIALVAYAVYFIMPFTRDMGDAGKRFLAAQSDIKLLKTKQTMAKELQGEIDGLNKQLTDQGSALLVGVDHARILRNLKKLTSGRAENVIVNVPKDAELVNRFLVQGVTLDFSTSYPDFLKIMDDLKKNELFSKVSYLSIAYSPGTQAAPAQSAGEATPGSAAPEGTASPEATATPSPTPLPTADKNVLSVHLELVFYALPPTKDNPMPQTDKPTVTARADALMPDK